MKLGHLTALFTILIWGTTFISTKLLLNDFKPIEILFFRSVIAFIALFIAYPKITKIKSYKEELIFIAAGLTGILFYHLLENIALTHTLTSNVGILVAISPFFTVFLSSIFLKEEESLSLNFFIGFLTALFGIYLITFNQTKVEINPIGDLLAIIASIVWAVYSILTKKISKFSYNTIHATRKIFGYGVLFMIPSLFFFDFSIDLSKLAVKNNMLNLIFLGLGASALCFVTWNYTVKVLGAVKTSVYIYLIPIVTVIFSILILDEQLTKKSVFGIFLIMFGLFLSKYSFKNKDKRA